MRLEDAAPTAIAPPAPLAGQVPGGSAVELDPFSPFAQPSPLPPSSLAPRPTAAPAIVSPGFTAGGELDPLSPSARALASALAVDDPFEDPPPPAHGQPDLGSDPFGVASAAPASRTFALESLALEESQRFSRPAAGSLDAPPAREELAVAGERVTPTGDALELAVPSPSGPARVDALDDVLGVASPPGPSGVHPPSGRSAPAASPGDAPAPASRLAPPSAPASATPHASTPSPPKPGPGPAEDAPPPGRREGLRRAQAAAVNALSLVALVGIALALLAGARGTSPAALAAGLRAAVTGRAPAPALAAAGLRTGLYDTAAGPALVVRGRVEVAAPTPGPVRVRAELVRGGVVLARAEGLAGATADAEEVHRSGTAEGASALRASLDARAARRIAPGEGAPFLLLVPAPAAPVTGAEVRVELEAPASQVSLR